MLLSGEQAKGSGYRLNIEVVQQEGVFVFPLWLEWQRDGTKIQKKFVIDKLHSEFDVDLDYKPTKIKINPNKAVPGEFD